MSLLEVLGVKPYNLPPHKDFEVMDGKEGSGRLLALLLLGESLLDRLSIDSTLLTD